MDGYLFVVCKKNKFMKVLKYVGKGLWEEIDEKDVLTTDRIEQAKRTKHTPTSRLESFFESLIKGIEDNGYKTIKVSSLLQSFSVNKRSTKNVVTIKEQLLAKGLYTLPEYSNELKLESTLRIYNYPVRQLGNLFSKEEDLEKYVEKNSLYKQLNIKTVIRQHSPKGTKDRLDFKGDCENEDIVVLELKNRGGGKSAVEQVLRYSALLTMEFPNRKIRQILVTGIQNYETALAIRGMLKEQRDLFEWYLYKYIKESNFFEFVKVTKEEIEHQTQS